MIVSAPADISLPTGKFIWHESESREDHVLVHIKTKEGTEATLHVPSSHAVVGRKRGNVIISSGYEIEEELAAPIHLTMIPEVTLDPLPLLIGLDALITKGLPYSMIYVERGSESWGLAVGEMGHPIIAEGPDGAHAYYLGRKGFRKIG